MGSLEDLWKLQELNNTLKEIDSGIDEISNRKKIEKLGDRLRRIEKKLIDLNREMEKNSEILYKDNSTLKEYEYKLGEIERNLYEGHIIDLKQLSFLDEEREEIKREIEEKELEILLGMEEMEELQEKVFQLKKDFKALRIEYTKLVKEYRALIEELKNKSKSERKKIEEISLRMDKNILNKYMNLIGSKGIAVVEVVDYKCSGCNMMLPAITVDRLKNHREIMHCENCDRILYIQEVKEG